MNKLLSKSLLGACAAVAMASTANAGGLERGGYNIDLLFDPSRVAGEVSGTYVMPQRDLNNVTDINPLNGNLNTRPRNDIRDTESYWVPRVGIKAGFGESIDCLVDYTQPWGAHSAPGLNWAGANDNMETKINSDGIGGTCSYKFDVGKGQFRVLGGAFYQQLDGFKERLVAQLPSPLLGNGIGRLDLEAEGYGWRIGGAYEIPEIALRASLVYNSAVKLDDITGTLDLRQISPLVNPLNPLLGRITNVFGAAEMPQSVEFKVQSGIAPGWLAFGSIKWVDWSVLQTVSFCPEATRAVPCRNGGATEATSLDLLYRDGWTVSGGVGHKFNDQWSGAASIAWDRGTSTTLGTQTDTWTFSAGASYTPNQNVELRLGGALGILTDGSSVSEEITSNFGNDLVAALNASLRVKW